MLISCPKCSFAGSTVEPTGLRKCLSCGRTWSEPLVYPQTPPFFSAAPQSGSERKRMLIVAGVIAAVVIGSIAIAVATVSSSDYDYDPVAEHPELFESESASPAPPAEHPELFESESASPTAPANYRVSAEIGAQCEGVSYSSRWFLHEYRNTGDGPISFPKILGRLRDADGATIRDIETVSNVYALPAGESAWLHTTLPKEAASAAFIVATPERVTQYVPAVSRLKLAEFKATPHATMPGISDLKGRVKNTHTRSLSSVLVQAIGFDGQGKPCSYTLVYAADKTIAPGASSSFAVTSGTWQTSVPERWEIHAWGMVEK